MKLSGYHRMEYFGLFIAGLSVFAYAVAATGAERYLAHYEINLDDGASVKTVKSSCYFTSGMPSVDELDKYTVMLTIEAGPTSDYVLTVAVKSSATAANTNTTEFSQSFNGRLSGPSNGPMEFQMQQHGLKVYGAIALSNPN